MVGQKPVDWLVWTTTSNSRWKLTSHEEDLSRHCGSSRRQPHLPDLAPNKALKPEIVCGFDFLAAIGVPYPHQDWMERVAQTHTAIKFVDHPKSGPSMNCLSNSWGPFWSSSEISTPPNQTSKWQCKWAEEFPHVWDNSSDWIPGSFAQVIFCPRISWFDK